MTRHPPISPLFPYRTLFLSRGPAIPRGRGLCLGLPVPGGISHEQRGTSNSEASAAVVRAPRLARSSGALPTRRRSSRSEEHTSELQSHSDLVCRLLLEKKKK